jgi:hypothetical protein
MPKDAVLILLIGNQNAYTPLFSVSNLSACDNDKNE